MKSKTFKLLLIIVILAIFISLIACNILGKQSDSWRASTSTFDVEISDRKQQNVIDFEITETEYLTVTIKSDDVDQDTYKGVIFEYNEQNATVEYRYTYEDEIRFKIYFFELATNQEVKISYKGQSVSLKYNVVDFNFNNDKFIAPTSISDLDKYPEFKEMLLSMQYYEFQGPYAGIRPHSNHPQDKYITLWEELNIDESDENYASTDYLQYLLDSVYYPTKFNMVRANPLSSRYIYIRLPKTADFEEGSSGSIMYYFNISMGVIDACCTNPQYPLHYMSFTGINKDYYSVVSPTFEGYPNQLKVLLEKYPERFLEYQMNDLTIYITYSAKNEPLAYFVHGDYHYELSATYIQEISDAE